MRHRSILWPLLALAGLFWVGVFFLPEPYVFEIANALVVSTALGVALGYGHAVFKILRLPYRLMTGADFLLLGVTLGAVAWVLQFIWRFYWRAVGQPQWMITHPVLAFLVFVSAVALSFHMVAKGAINDQVPRRNWLVLGATVAVTLFGVMLLFITLGPGNTPNTSPNVTR